MRINFAHLRERGAAGGYINFVVFDARSSSGSNTDNAALLNELTFAVRQKGFAVDQSALAFMAGGRLSFFGSKPLVEYLSGLAGLPGWTHFVDI